MRIKKSKKENKHMTSKNLFIRKKSASMRVKYFYK